MAYPVFPTRLAQTLDGAWEFAFLSEKPNINELSPDKVIYNGLMAVPGVFDTCPEYFGKRGIGMYRRKVNFAADSNARFRLKLGGLGLYGRVWWDGREIGRCDLPYSSICYDFAAGPGQEHELVIAVDNRVDQPRTEIFSPYFDFYGYGGIYRSVELQQLPECFVERVQVKTLELDSHRVKLKIMLGGNIPPELEVTVAFDRKEAVELSGKPVDGTIEIEQTVPGGKLWSPENPALHTVEVSVAGDSIIERFGIRTVETRKRQILVNGNPVFLRGVNRHESHPEFGPVQNTHLMLDDLRLLKDLGCNFVRCVHYPQDQAFLDLCDQLGILVWQESMGWNNPEKDTQNQEFCEMQCRQTKLMVKNSINHPSIILWGFMNECCSETESGKELYRSLAQIIKTEDPALLVTYASNKAEKDICFDCLDVVSINTYPGWISNIDDWVTESKDWIADRITELVDLGNRTDTCDKPFIISEIGACGIYGLHDRANAQWSEEFQAGYFAEACRCILDNPRFAGIALWQMFDTRSYVNAGQVRSKPRGFNCAGLLDEYRRPKQAYDTVKRLFLEHRQPIQKTGHLQ